MLRQRENIVSGILYSMNSAHKTLCMLVFVFIWVNGEEVLVIIRELNCRRYLCRKQEHVLSECTQVSSVKDGGYIALGTTNPYCL